MAGGWPGEEPGPAGASGTISDKAGNLNPAIACHETHSELFRDSGAEEQSLSGSLRSVIYEIEAVSDRKWGSDLYPGFRRRLAEIDEKAR